MGNIFSGDLSWLVWVIIGIVAVALIVVAVVAVVKIAKMEPAKRKELVSDFLIGLVTNAEGMFTEHGKGAEKLAIVEEQFKKTAPWFLKLVYKFSGCETLDEVVKMALKKVQETWGK